MGIPKNKYFTCKLKIDEIYLNLGIAKAALQPHSSTFYDLNKSGLPMSKIKNLAFLSAIISFTFTLNIAYAANCTVIANAQNVNLNQYSGRTEVKFLNCKNGVYFHHEFLNSSIRGQYSDPTLVLDGNPNIYIELPYDARVGANWQYRGESSSVVREIHTYGTSSNTTEGTMYLDMSLAQFGDISKYPVGIYRTSIIYSAIEH